MKLATLLLLAASLQAQTGDSFLLCLFVAVVIMCEGAALLWGPRWLKWTITVIAAFITLAMLGVCIAYGQTVITRSYGEQRLTCRYRPIPKPSGGAKR